jgi:hypothetical protein
MTTLSVRMTERLAQMLWANSSSSDILDMQPDRFRQVEPNVDPNPKDSAFVGGTMFWCESGADALLLRAYEQATGRSVTLLSDEAVSKEWPYSYVVLSSRRWTHG